MLFIKHLLINKIVIRPALPREKNHYTNIQKKKFVNIFRKKIQKNFELEFAQLEFRSRTHIPKKHVIFISQSFLKTVRKLLLQDFDFYDSLKRYVYYSGDKGLFR